MRPRTLVISIFAAFTAAGCATGGGDTGSGYQASNSSSGYPASYDPSNISAQQTVSQRYADSTITEAQRILGARGYYVGNVDGIWGPDSQVAAEQFQREHRLQVTGRLDGPTLDALNVKAGGSQDTTSSGRYAANSNASIDNASDGNTSENGQSDRMSARGSQNPGASDGGSGTSLNTATFREAQRSLGDKGYDVGAVDGIWGPRSSQALKNFERDQGMPQDGRLDAQALEALDVEQSGDASSQSSGVDRSQDNAQAIHKSQELNDPAEYMEGSRTRNDSTASNDSVQ